MRIKWINSYYIKGQQWKDLRIPAEASWLVRAIVEMKQYMHCAQRISKTGSLTKQVYPHILDYSPRATWKFLVFGNNARSKARFTLWMQVHGRLLTADRTTKMGYDCGYHIVKLLRKPWSTYFVHCQFTKQLWAEVMRWMKGNTFTATNWDHHQD